ncbi:MAG: ankyrin repeat domain-containing protein [Planctomycetaceae bacterium]|jgi:tetratricopeptide (TPR) repeat protein|nr:ankyrin repeat domain-containing protein [Planctomycetaceae bacterium]
MRANFSIRRYVILSLFLVVLVNCDSVITQAIPVIQSNQKSETITQNKTSKPQTEKSESRYEQLLKRGNILFEKKEFDSALKDFNAAISLKSDNSKAFAVRGWVYLEKKNFDKAIEDFNEAIHLNPNGAEGYTGRCIYYFCVKKDFDKALADFKEATRLEPNSKESVQKLFSNMYLQQCIEFYLQDPKDRQKETLDETEFKLAKEIAGKKIPNETLESSQLRRMDLKFICQWTDLFMANLIVKNTKIYVGDVDITILHLAAFGGQLEIVKSLIERGADVDTKNDRNRFTPLAMATMSGQLEVVKYLIEKGADVNTEFVAEPGGKLTPLFVAVLEDKPEVTKYLLEKGANTNVKNKDGDTPLHNAVYNGHVEAIKVLVNAGADINAKNNQGETPQDVAKTEAIKEILHGKVSRNF